MKQLPTVSVIIPCRNERGHIEIVLKSVSVQQPAPKGGEVIVAKLQRF